MSAVNMPDQGRAWRKIGRGRQTDAQRMSLSNLMAAVDGPVTATLEQTGQDMKVRIGMRLWDVDLNGQTKEL